MTAAMTDAQWIGTWLVGSLTAWLILSLAASFIWARINANLAPQRTLADRMEAARTWDPVAEAEDITKEAAR